MLSLRSLRSLKRNIKHNTNTNDGNEYVKYKVYKFVDYDELPEFFRRFGDTWRHMGKGLCLLEEFNDKIANDENIEKFKDILLKYFDIRMNGLEPIKIYVGEYKIAFMEFYLEKIRVYVDCD